MTRPMISTLADPADLDFSPGEVKQLWWFRDGAIMSVPIRDRLWDARGLCHRHAWGYAILEIELLAGQAFSTAVLYADLTDRAAKLVGKRGMRKPKLNADGPCMTCDHIRTTASQTLTGAEWPRGAVRVNRAETARELVSETESVWRAASCPACGLGGSGPTCRPHLIAGAPAPAGLSDTLADIAGRLEPLVSSMTVARTTVGLAEQASWIEAIGWFTGWTSIERC